MGIEWKMGDREKIFSRNELKYERSKREREEKETKEQTQKCATERESIPVERWNEKWRKSKSYSVTQTK